MKKKFDWMDEAKDAIRQYFNDRNAARGRQGKRVVLREKFQELKMNGDMVYTYTYGGETVSLVKGAYSCEIII